MRDREAGFLVAEVLGRAGELTPQRRDELIVGLIQADPLLGDRRAAVIAAYRTTAGAFRARRSPAPRVTTAAR